MNDSDRRNAIQKEKDRLLLQDRFFHTGKGRRTQLLQILVDACEKAQHLTQYDVATALYRSRRLETTEEIETACSTARKKLQELRKHLEDEATKQIPGQRVRFRIGRGFSLQMEWTIQAGPLVESSQPIDPLRPPAAPPGEGCHQRAEHDRHHPDSTVIAVKSHTGQVEARAH